MPQKSKLRFLILVLIAISILLLPSIVRAQTPISCGQTLSGTISTAGEKDSFSFDASANDGITIRARKTSGTLTPYLELYGPGGGLITSAPGKIDRILTETGTHRIDVRDQNNTNTGDYLLYWERMNNPCNVASSVDCSQVVSGSIGTGVDPPPWKVHTFSASANDVVTIRATKTSGTNFTPYLELYSPSGSYLVGGSSKIDRTLTVAGTYKLLLRDTNDAYSGNYVLTWLKVKDPCNATAISCGQILSGSVSGAGEIDAYTFVGSVNDVVTIRARKTSGNFTPNLELYSPTGSLLVGPGTQIDRTLTTAGTYTVLVRDQNNLYMGDYILYLEKLNNPCNVAASLACDQVVSGSIGTTLDPPPWRVYRFTVSANDSVTIRARKISGESSFGPYMELYDPSGTYLVAGSNPTDRKLTVAGTYTLLVRDGYNAYAGNFTLIWWRVVNPCSSTPISCGQVLSGTISAADEIDFYTFTVLANDKVTIRPRKTSGSLTPSLELYGPSGSRVAGPTAQIDMTLTATGTYVLLIRDYSSIYTGDYLLYLEKLNNPCNVAATLACDQVMSGSVGMAVDPPPWRIYRFTVSANDSVTIRTRKTSGTSFAPQMELYDPSGTYLASEGSQIDRKLTVAGTYTLLVRDAYNAYAGDFNLSWRRVVNPCSSTPISCGQVLSGEISAADEIDMYTFAASANDVVIIRARRTSGNLYARLELYNPNGSRIGDSESINTTLSATGTYTILVRDNTYVNTGSYVLVLQRMNNPCSAAAINCGSTASGSIGTALDPPPWRFYTFTASANDVAQIRITNPSGGSFSPYFELYNPAGSCIVATNRLDISLTATGTYTILVRDFNNAYSGSFLLYWERLKNLCNVVSTIECGQEVRGWIGTTVNPPPWRVYTITAAAGDNIVLTMTALSGGLDPYIELYNSSGTKITNSSGNPALLTQTLSTGGQYTVIISEFGNNETGKYKLKFQKNSNYCPEVTVTAPNGGEIIKGGSNFAITWTSASPRGINSQEIRLSTNGGVTFPTVVATGLAGGVQSFDWSIPTDINTATARIRVIATDTSGMSTPDDSDGDFTVFQGVDRQYVYDELNRLIRVIYEDGKIINYTYDAGGNRITLTTE